MRFGKVRRINAQGSVESRRQFSSNCKWTGSTLETAAKQVVKTLLVEFHDISAQHRFDIGYNTEFMDQITPLDVRLAYNQCLPAPINLKDDILVELALLQKYRIITTLSISIYASPILAQRKLNGKLRLLIDLGQISTLIAANYIKIIHAVSTISDAA